MAGNPSCLPCPTEGDCTLGADNVLFPLGNWSKHAINSMYILTSCPVGHQVVNSSSREGNIFSNDGQTCTFCDKGEECRQIVCMSCFLCAPGFHKASVRTDACVQRPAGTYREEEGATDFGMCLGCQLKSLADTLEGQNSRRVCVCDMAYYLITADKDLTSKSLLWQTCPKGVVCGNGECALRKSGFSCFDGTCSFVGEWVLNNVEQYELTSCPAGYEMRTALEQGSLDLQQCYKCPSASTCILRPDVDSCEPCPPGLTCNYDASLTPTVQGSVWVEQDTILKLESYPSGYYVFPKSTDTFDSAQQKCLPCEKFEDCTTAHCFWQALWVHCTEMHTSGTPPAPCYSLTTAESMCTHSAWRQTNFH